MRGHVLAVLVFLLAPPSTEGAFFSPRAMLVPTLQRATSCFACAAEDAREVLKAKLEDAVVEREPRAHRGPPPSAEGRACGCSRGGYGRVLGRARAPGDDAAGCCERAVSGRGRPG